MAGRSGLGRGDAARHAVLVVLVAETSTPCAGGWGVADGLEPEPGPDGFLNCCMLLVTRGGVNMRHG